MICKTMPTIDDPTPKAPESDQTQEAATIADINKKVNAMSGTAEGLGDVAKNALSSLTGLLANIASFNSAEKRDYDEDGNLIVDGINIYKKRYRSNSNLTENMDIAKAMQAQKAELDEAKKVPENVNLEFINDNDIANIIAQTQDALQARIFGPLWRNWTTGTDFLAAIKAVLQNLLDIYDPILDIVDQLQDYVNESTSSIKNAGIDVKMASGKTTTLPLGLMAIQALNIIIDYIRSLIRNLEMIMNEYSAEELNVLVRKGTNGASIGTIIKSIEGLIQVIINCIKPYITNLVMALILDAIDVVVDALDKAGILSPKGPLKLIPIAITLVRAIIRGDLEAIEEMIKQTIIKLVNVVQLAIIAVRDPSILWADTDRMDKEISLARYLELTKGEYRDLTPEEKAKFFGTSKEFNPADITSYSVTSGARHFLQKMKGETPETLNKIVDFMTGQTDWAAAYLNARNASKAAKENSQASDPAEVQAAADIQAATVGQDNCIKEPVQD